MRSHRTWEIGIHVTVASKYSNLIWKMWRTISQRNVCINGIDQMNMTSALGLLNAFEMITNYFYNSCSNSLYAQLKIILL